MKRIMVIGEGKSGKSKLISDLSGEHYEQRKVLALDYFRNFVNTPSEFLENRRFYHAIITASAECDVLLFVQDATKKTCQMPPLFASMFNRHSLGVITRVDKEGANIERARKFLRNTGLKEIYAISVFEGTGMLELRKAIYGTADGEPA